MDSLCLLANSSIEVCHLGAFLSVTHPKPLPTLNSDTAEPAKPEPTEGSQEPLYSRQLQVSRHGHWQLGVSLCLGGCAGCFTKATLRPSIFLLLELV